MSLDPLATDFVKQEPEWDGGGSCSAAELLLSLEFMAHTIKEDVKEETDGADEAVACLYAGHEVKDELVLGPECLQPADVAFTLQAPAPTFIERPVLRDGVVRLERVPEHEPPARSGTGCGVGQSRSGKTLPSVEARENSEPSRDYYSDHTYAKTDGPKATPPPGVTRGIQGNNILYNYQPTATNYERCIALRTNYCPICLNSLMYTGSRPSCCDDCKQRIKHSYQLKCQERRNYELNNTGKPYRCAKCKSKFKHLRGLTLHERIHTEPYSCKICKKKYIFFSRLQRHELIHTREKPYSCGRCRRKFRHMRSLNKHKLKHISIPKGYVRISER